MSHVFNQTELHNGSTTRKKKKNNDVVTMTMKSMKYSDCDTIMDGYNPVPPPLPRRVPPVRNIYAEPFATETNTAR